ncbi:MAG: hypothetical protein NT163_04315 [Chlorobiales bacterium]|nr:hypothetical protein [Chlorobiales bacterium]
MSKIFVNIGLSLDGYMAPEGMTMENPGYKNWGRRTYQIFEAYWPYQPDASDCEDVQCSEKVCCFPDVNDAPLEQLKFLLMLFAIS